MSLTIQDNQGVSKANLERDCIIFLPGIGGEIMDQSIDGLARRLAAALDTNAQDTTAVFYSKVKAVEDLNTCKGDVGTLYRKDDSGDRPFLDIYKVDYRDTLIERYENRNLLVKALLLLVALPGTLMRLLRAIFTGKASKTRVEKMQLLYALGILSLLVIYVVILFSAVWATINGSSGVLRDITAITQKAGNSAQQTWQRIRDEENIPQKETTNQEKPAAASPQQDTSSTTTEGEAVNVWLRISQLIVVLWAAISLFLPPKFNLKELISKASVDFLCLIYYLNLGEQRNSIIGRVELLIDEVLRKSGNELKKGNGNHYRHIYIFAYSFGSIVALDALFPVGKKPGRAFQSVHTLVTIGCPFDFVRTFWSDYFDQRREYAVNIPIRWLNVYSPVDVLGSNFRNDPQADDANINIRAEQTNSAPDVPKPINVPFTDGLNFSGLSWLSSLTLIGLRSHSTYWSSKPAPEVNCFNELVVKIYDGDPVLD
jgi:hypothetical protein